jgi:RimJ/RimL family protein N-acetyltransferase
MPRRARDLQELTRGRRVRGLARAAEIGTTVFLRTPVAADREEFRALRRGSHRFLAPWEPRPEPGDADPFTRLLRARRDPRHVRFLVCARASGTIMGGIALDWRARGDGRRLLLAQRGERRVH